MDKTKPIRTKAETEQLAARIKRIEALAKVNPDVAWAWASVRARLAKQGNDRLTITH